MLYAIAMGQIIRTGMAKVSESILRVQPRTKSHIFQTGLLGVLEIGGLLSKAQRQNKRPGTYLGLPSEVYHNCRRFLSQRLWSRAVKMGFKNLGCFSPGMEPLTKCPIWVHVNRCEAIRNRGIVRFLLDINYPTTGACGHQHTIHSIGFMWDSHG